VLQEARYNCLTIRISIVKIGVWYTRGYNKLSYTTCTVSSTTTTLLCLCNKVFRFPKLEYSRKKIYMYASYKGACSNKQSNICSSKLSLTCTLLCFSYAAIEIVVI
jgi:hypothetical protein